MKILLFCLLMIICFQLAKILSKLKSINLVHANKKVNSLEIIYISIIKAYYEFFSDFKKFNNNRIKLFYLIEELGDPIKQKVLSLKNELKEEFDNYLEDTIFLRKDNQALIEKKKRRICSETGKENFINRSYKFRNVNFFNSLSKRLDLVINSLSVESDLKTLNEILEICEELKKNIDRLQIISLIILNKVSNYFYDLNTHFISGLCILILNTGNGSENSFWHSNGIKESQVTFIGEEEIKYTLDLSNFGAMLVNLQYQKRSFLNRVSNQMIETHDSNKHMNSIRQLATVSYLINNFTGENHKDFIQDFIESLKLDLYDGDFGFINDGSIDFPKIYHSQILDLTSEYLQEDDKQLLRLFH